MKGTRSKVRNQRPQQSRDKFDSLSDMAGEIMRLGFKSMSQTMEMFNEMNPMMASGKRRSKGCGCCGPCSCYDKSYMDEVCDCLPCGPAISTTDMVLEARLGERRKLSFVIENNLNKDSDFALSVEQFIDKCGNQMEPKGVFNFTPERGTIPACGCIQIDVWVEVVPPLEDSNVYYADIKIDGQCCSNSLSLGIWVYDDCLNDFIVLCDPCRPKKSKFVEMSNCDCCSCGDHCSCGCDCKCHRTSRKYNLC